MKAIIDFLKNWTLPSAIVAGTVIYLIFYWVPALDPVSEVMAPIFDTGRAFGGRGIVPYTDDEIENIEVNSFEQTENELLALLPEGRKTGGFDIGKALPAERIRQLYEMDSKARPGYIDSVVRLYEIKKKMIEALA